MVFPDAGKKAGKKKNWRSRDAFLPAEQQRSGGGPAPGLAEGRPEDRLRGGGAIECRCRRTNDKPESERFSLVQGKKQGRKKIAAAGAVSFALRRAGLPPWVVPALQTYSQIPCFREFLSEFGKKCGVEGACTCGFFQKIRHARESLNVQKRPCCRELLREFGEKLPPQIPGGAVLWMAAD
jgi:hypothetical protein